MINLQKIEPFMGDQEGLLHYVDLWETIQGEGPFVGTPAIFLRLAGCSLMCPACDTDYTSNRKTITTCDLTDKVCAIKPGRLVVITGGEPMRQPIGRLVNKLVLRGHGVQIETNGLHHIADLNYNYCTIVCSPKTPKINSQLIPHIAALKYVLSADAIDPIDGLPTGVLGYKTPPQRPWSTLQKSQVYVQPADEAREGATYNLNLTAALDSCFKFGYRYCHQIHKVIGVK